MTNNTLAEALEPFAAVADEFFEEASDDMRPFHPCSLGEFRRARDALATLRASTDAAAVGGSGYPGSAMSDDDLNKHYEESKKDVVCLVGSEVRQIIGELRYWRAHPPVADAAVAGEGLIDLIEAAISEGQQDNGWTDYTLAKRVHEALLHRLSHPAHAEPVGLREASVKDALSSLVAALSILTRAHAEHKEPCKVVASNTMFEQMLKDYQASVDRVRATLTRTDEAQS